MVDFNTLRQRKNKTIAIRPQEIFRSLPKPTGINDLYESQGKVLTEWFECRENKDTVIKLHTGGGKTLVGLLIAQSSINEKREPALYICSTQQLVKQTIEKANALNIKTVPYVTGAPLDDDFINGKAIMVCTYHAIFNGKSKFKLRGSATPPIKVSAVIVDDAHVAFSYIRDIFTVEIDSENNLFSSLAGIFRESFKYCNKLGTFDDTISGKSDSILEVPYWEWFKKLNAVQTLLSESNDEKLLFAWPMLRDNLKFCHAIISNRKISITPHFPLVDLFPTFSEAPRRIYMSATISDDSEIVRTFDASEKDMMHPLTSPSLAGISERMILAPHLMNLETDIKNLVLKICKWTAIDKKLGVVILTPSQRAAHKYSKEFAVASNSSEVETNVKLLQEKKHMGPFVFANRYDGIDLPGDSCRLLVMDGLPIGTSTYEMFLTSSLFSGDRIDRLLAQRIEQGIGRGARGAGDHCVVILESKQLSSWLGKSDHLDMLTGPTTAQILIGTEISEAINNDEDLLQTIEKSYARDGDWTTYHAESLSEQISGNTLPQTTNITIASIERDMFKLWRDGYYEKAIKKIDKIKNSSKTEKDSITVDSQMYGWLRQFAAKIAYDWGQYELSQRYQQDAFACNRNLLRPLGDIIFQPLPQPTAQSEAIVKNIKKYRLRKSFINYFDEATSCLTSSASANQFEESLKNLGQLLGFVAERYDIKGNGPDVLWLLPHNVAFAIEAKSRKKDKNVFNKEEHGQLLVAEEWVKRYYPNCICKRIAVCPSNKSTKNAYAQESYALTLVNINRLVADARYLFEQLCERNIDDETLNLRCVQLLHNSNINSQNILASYMENFIAEDI